MTRVSAHERVLVIEGGSRSTGFFREIWEYRELLALLAWRDVAVRYKQTFFGLAWAVIRPLLMTLVLVLVFSVVVRVPSPDAPYALLVLGGLLIWQLVAATVGSAAESLLSNSSVLSKVYFPRALLPISAAATPLIDFLVGLVLYGMLMAWYGVTPTWRIVLAPLMAVLAICIALGAGLLLSAAVVLYRDLRHLVSFILQLGLYASPVAYPSALVPERWQVVYSLNPAVGVVEGIRWALLGAPFLNAPALIVSAVTGCALLVVGIAYFRRVERSIVDAL